MTSSKQGTSAKSFVGVKALSDANFLLREGEICGLVGANGSGEDHLCPDRERAAHARTAGSSCSIGTPVNLRSRQDAERSRMAMVHQNLSLVPEMTIWENIALGREKTGAMGFLDNSERRRAGREGAGHHRREAISVTSA